MQQLANAVASANATRHRLSADLVAVAGTLRAGVADTEVTPRVDADSGLVDALSRAAGVPIVLDAVAQDYRRESRQAGGWLFTRWLSSVKADPLAEIKDALAAGALTGPEAIDRAYQLGFEAGEQAARKAA